jgi:hypothetical protein
MRIYLRPAACRICNIASIEEKDLHSDSPSEQNAFFIR